MRGTIATGVASARPQAVGVLLVFLAMVGGCERPETRPPGHETVAPAELATSADVPTLHETLAEYARGVPNYGYAPGSPARTWAIYCPSFDISELDAEHREFQALLESFSPGIRARFEGAVAARIAAFEKERERREAQSERDEAERKRDEAEYAVFIEKHLRRQYSGWARD